MAVTVSDQDRHLLRMIADGEAVRSNPYCSVWPGHVEPSLTSMTISQVQAYQQQRLDAGRRSSAVGKYQMLKDVLGECAGYLGCDPLRTVYSPDVQDAMIIQRLVKFRKYEQWKTDSINTGQFMVFLAAEFASMPVPYDIPAGSVYKNQPKRNLKKGQSFYANDGLNKANHDPDTVYQQLEDIKNGGRGEVTEINVSTSGANRGLPASGVSERTQVERAAAGSGVGAYRGTRAGAAPLPSTELPNYDNPYTYYVIDPLDDRYDFRSGEKVKDVLIHGLSAAAATPTTITTVGESNTTTDAGVIAPKPPEQDPDASDPRGQEQLPDLVPKPDEPDPLPTGETGNADSGAPKLPYPDDIIKDALGSVADIFPDDTGDCVNEAVTGNLKGALDKVSNGLVTDANNAIKLAENEVNKVANEVKNTAKNWINT